MKPLYIVFDQLPSKTDGGLVATYARLVEELSDTYKITILNIFDGKENDIEEFNNVPIISLCPIKIDNRFYKAFSLLRKGEIVSFFWALFSFFAFFVSIPIARHKTSASLSDAMVIASSPAAAIFLGKKVKYLLEIHTNFEYFWGNNPIGRLQSSLFNPPVLTLFRNKTDAEKGLKLFPSSFIYNGFDDSSLKPTKQRKHHSALFVGRLEPQKNPLRLLECAELVLEKVPDFTLDIYGTGSLKTTLENEIEKRNLEKCVSLKGFTADKSVYSGYEIFWLTSTNEGFGLVLTESMANRTPVITTNWGDAVSEIVKDGKTGFIAQSSTEFANYSTGLLLDSESREKMGREGRSDFVQRFSAKQNKERWIEILSSNYPSNDK